MKTVGILWTVMITVALLVAGCGNVAPTPTTGTDAGSGGASAGTSGDLDGASTLALGTLKLEGTGDALTPAQAAALLPLWLVIQGGSLQGSAETDAVVQQVAGVMTESQLAAIDAMTLTRDDVQGWMQERGVEMPESTAGQQGAPAGMQDMSEDERAKMRKELETPGGVSEQERATRIADLGIERPEGAEGARPGSGGQGTSGFLFGALVELLGERAAA